MAIHSKTPPLVILGFDVGDLDSIRRWAEEGYLPTIASIMERGCWGRTGGPELVCSYSIWASMLSGISRSQHGHYYFRQLKPGTYDLKNVREPDEKIRPFWSYLKGKNKKVAIIDAPDAHPISELKGIQLADWASHDSPVTTAAAEPPELLEEVRQVFGPRMIVDETLNFEADEDRQIYRQLLERVEKKGALCRYLLDRDHADVIVIIFSESHIANHQFWRHQPQAQASDRMEAPDLTNAIRDVLQAIDREMGLLLAQLPSEAHVFVLSETGMETHYPNIGLIEAFCRNLGYQASPETGVKTSLSLMDLLRRVLPQSVRIALSQRFLSQEKREQLLADQFRTSTDWQKTSAFSIPSFYPGFIHVNLRGRQPEGIVEPGEEYYALLDQLEADLRQLRDPQTGESVVKDVVRTCDLFGDGPPAALPDLFVQWKPIFRFMERVVHPNAELVQQKPEFFRDSDHSHNGFIAAAGLSIQKQGDMGDVSLLDLAPTFLSLIGEPIPEKMTGKVIGAMIQGSVYSS